MVGPELPWSKNQLRRLGKAIRDGQPVPAECPSYGEVLEGYTRLCAFVAGELLDMDWSPLLERRTVTVSSRPKTLDTLREKLKKSPNFPLHTVHDLAGVRFEADMNLDEQDAVATAIVGHFSDMGVIATTRDYRSTGGHSGYRAIHVVLQLDGLVELQIRTALQGEWANLYEVVADRLGRFIRYDELPADPDLRAFVQSVQSYSLQFIRDLEQRVTEIERNSIDLPGDDPQVATLRHGCERLRTEVREFLIERQRQVGSQFPGVT